MIYDCGGYATKVGLRCADGRTIMKDAFLSNDGQEVPVVWQHQRNEPDNVLGHALLENRNDGVYAYLKFNDTDNGQTAKTLVEHGDIRSLSIYANNLVENSRKDVQHGVIREVSLVIAGANPGARIDKIYIEHADGSSTELPDEAVIRFGQELSGPGEFEHAESAEDESDDGDETIEDVLKTMNPKQRKVVNFLVGKALQHSDDPDGEDPDEDKDPYEDPEDDDSDEKDVEHSDEGGVNMHNVFENQGQAATNELTHDEMTAIMKNAQRLGSLKAAVEDAQLEHGITDIDILFPEAKSVTPTPEMLMRDQDWVSKVWAGTRKSPFSRIKTVVADLTKDEARAKGYIKGREKQEEQFGLLKRVTTPQTVYKKQALDRDDVVDITDFDVVAWLKAEMRVMLNEELARAVLVGDGRTAGAEDKINESNIRPIYTDADMYTIKHAVNIAAGATNDEKADAIVDAANRSRKDYKGSGSPTFFTDSDTLTTLLLAKDKVGRKLYPTMTELASALRVQEIVEVPLMEGLTRTTTPAAGESAKTMQLLGIIVNLKDYTVGADRGGAVSMFDDFDIDYNKQKYLIETRCSGALTMPYSAIVLETEVNP